MLTDIAAAIASQLRLRPQQVQGALKLLDENNSIPFIAHHRREQTGGLAEEALLRILECREKLGELESRKDAVLRSIREQGKLTPELEEAVGNAGQLRVVEDIYLAFRPARNTAAALAIDRGLEPLADLILEGRPGGALEDWAANFIRHEREVHTTEDALSGAGHIVAERFSANGRIRQKARDLVWSQGILRCTRGPIPESQVKEFRDYYNFSEPVKNLPAHRVLAVNRGERRKALKVALELPPDLLLGYCRELVIPPGHPWAALLERCLRDALDRLVLPAISREVRRELSERAEDHAVDVFANNVRGILMTPPVRGLRVLAVDPGFRTGCKVAALDAQGQLLGETIVYPHEPQCRWDEAKTALVELVQKHSIDVVAIGNGTGCHETEKLVAEIIAAHNLTITYTFVSEAGITTYAASTLGHEEFPNLDPALRATVSVGRRLQDPLSEFVRVDPRVIGVGLYQHDSDQRRLKQRLDAVVQSCVNRIGVDVNTAHVALLENVAGFNSTLARQLIAYREQVGPFKSREDLRKVPGLDEHVFCQCAGFLKVAGSAQPLDATRIHPDHYGLAEELVRLFGCSAADLTRPEGLPALRPKLEGLSLEKMAQRLGVGIPTLSHVLYCLEHPQADPRDQNPPPIFKREMIRLEDLRPGMWLKGAVRNVVDFGAFVDIGVKEDGLVHISQFSTRYIKNPMDYLHVGQTVDVRILSVDKDRRRIALSMIPQEQAGAGKPAPPAAGPGPTEPPASAGPAPAEPPAPPPSQGTPAPSRDAP